jgi:hypothetical protein
MSFSFTMRRLPWALACAACLMGPVAHAASTVTVQWSNLSLTITDANGHVTSHDDFLASGDSSSQNSLILAHGDPNLSNSNILDGARPMPSMRADAFGQAIGATRVGQALSISPSGQATLTTELSSLAGLVLPSAGDKSEFLMTGGLAPAFFGQATTDPAFDFMHQPVHGGIWVAAGETVTLSGNSTSLVSLDTGDFATTQIPFSADILAGGAMLVGLARDGGSLSDATLSDPQGGSASKVIFDSSLSVHAPLSDSLDEFISASLTNTSGEGRWLVLGVGGLIDVALTSASPSVTPPGGSLVPEPGTYALMGLGLVGVALAARRQRARNC